MTEPTKEPGGHPHPPDWSSSDSVLEGEIREEERRIAQDERRIAEDERRIRLNRLLAIAALSALALTVVALILSIIALNRDIESVAKATPKDNSVGTSSIKDRAVTGAKIANGAVGAEALAAKAVNGAKVGNDSLTGVQINEASLAQVPKSGTADNALKLGGVAAAGFVSGVRIVQHATDPTSATLKGPILASCPSGTRVIGGGAQVDGSRNVAIIESAPSGTSAWTAIAGLQTGSAPSWRLTVFAICATGGS